ncbi:MAG: hypothetical protein M5R38_10835 [Candidatus Methylomirabilis sp.]|nr:hypothetical protein [Candidatus Methylomirabilis sp.]
MHLKRFRAATMDEALRQIGEELGPEAVILHTKSIPLADGLSFTRRQGVEVMAALDGDPPKCQVSSVKCQVLTQHSTLNTQHSTPQLLKRRRRLHLSLRYCDASLSRSKG